MKQQNGQPLSAARACRWAGVVLAALVLGACSDPIESDSQPATATPAVPPSSFVVIGGQNIGVDERGCTAYGAPPRPERVDLRGALFSLLQVCPAVGGETLSWTDPQGRERSACLVLPAKAMPDQALPLLVWLHPSLTADNAILQTGLATLAQDYPLSATQGVNGYALLMPLGRVTDHYYPFPDDVALGWDVWYRNFDRNSPAINVDAAAIDAFIDRTRTLHNIDPHRQYVAGWSAGAAMAALYALNRPGIAAAALYSTSNPFSSPEDPCPAAVSASNKPAWYQQANSCDVGGSCQQSQQFSSDLVAAGLVQDLQLRLLDTLDQPQQSCEAFCDVGALGASTLGLVNHLKWHTSQTTELLDYLRLHPAP